MKESGMENFKNAIEASANYQGNWALLSYERWKTKESMEKLAHLYYKHLTTLEDIEDLEDELKQVPFVLTNIGDGRYDLDKEIAERNQHIPRQEWKTSKTYKELLREMYPFLADLDELKNILETKSKEYCEQFIVKKLRESLDAVFSSTEIDHKGFGSSGKPGRVGIVTLRSVEILPGVSFNTAHQQSVTEAHEKGHGMRSFRSPSDVTEDICSGFDIDKVKLSEKLVDINVKALQNMRPELSKRRKVVGKTKEQLIYYETHPIELLERMSQLKNYFGMSQYEQFTKEHLDYAREHFAKDIGGVFDMQMEAFFSMITKEKEERFLELMNTLPL